MARHNKHVAIAHEALLGVAGGRRAGGGSLATRHKEAPLAATSPSLPLPPPALPWLQSGVLCADFSIPAQAEA